MNGENDKLIRDFMNAFEKKDVKVLEEFVPRDIRQTIGAPMNKGRQPHGFAPGDDAPAQSSD